ncbi:MAG: hypothetical protein MZV65_39550 [Chromatiales bacterium]|nr:hypothetical protein [Chromatiales bacterium]MCK7581132.1 hypothetical protein [Chromatiales bacterium]
MSNTVKLDPKPSVDHANGHSLAVDAFVSVKDIGLDDATSEAVRAVLEVLSDKDTDAREFLTGYIGLLLDVIAGGDAA